MRWRRSCDEDHDRPRHPARDHPALSGHPEARCRGEHVLVHTGQNFDDRLNELFFRELGVRRPDYSPGGARHGIADQIGQILVRCEEVFRKERPDRLLILGDTNSSLSAIIAKRLGIPVYHMEAGNRCYDDRVPEEVNRRMIDHSSDVLMPYTERSRQNLLREGIARRADLRHRQPDQGGDRRPRGPDGCVHRPGRPRRASPGSTSW